jgi:hypothetical protein
MAVFVSPVLWLVAWPTLGVSEAILATGLTWIVLHVAILTRQLGSIELRSLQPAAVGAAMGQLLRYGGPRVPGGIAAAALFSLPVILAARGNDLLAATYIGTGVSLLTMTAMLIKPFTLAVLSTASQMLATNDLHVLRRAVIQYGVVGGLAAAVVVGLAEWMLPTVLAGTWARNSSPLPACYECCC